MMVNFKEKAKEVRAKREIARMLEERAVKVAMRDSLKEALEIAEQELKETNGEIEAVMRANKMGMPGKTNPALEIGEVKLKIVEGENRYVKEKELLPALVPLFSQEEEPIREAKAFLAKYTDVKEYSYVRITVKKTEEEGKKDE